MIVLLLLLFINAISIISSNMTCSGNATFLSCFDSSLSFNISSTGGSGYSVSYLYNNSTYIFNINYSNNVYSFFLAKNSGVLNFSVYNNTFFSIIEDPYNNKEVILLLRLNNSAPPLSPIESMELPSFVVAATNIFNLYSVPLVLIFLIIIANLSGFPLTYKAGVVALASFLAGLILQNPIFYFISFVAIIALALLKYGGR